ncbi:post-GPI attachment to proteins factor 3-like [Mizuhopecten yessoensis]|uniref:Post-GPI attachment to proteins factor 3 n=1 Tax=Mizuhopecten yessoensis TaxID=6573 RepID=A0A210PGN3_MIZYE|nr:post-GPI attachment to proteins factor 3-like [Mizuhopecten yessoensis]XP_021342097.1 post-GPI attachment to proteins factor 3-like [Mizuhopecten yessoensis]XP_021342098.1 post-GPI attachment to proteins factor 3-like [Mizuhopecten yessoensis]XP_021342099.1 post-GPI attachment to proteins factor 3-like [Mizuhopecten yessoensis]OWF35639.1 Post-GPI attachment to proteins factor 3 [Mizuhopecten yessoensis]
MAVARSIVYSLLTTACGVLWLVKLTNASYGDRSYVFQRCTYACMQHNCTDTQALEHFSASQPWHQRTLRWTCEDECNYICMWTTVDAFQKDGIGTPHFHGKWPFIRLFGIQEPASVLFSILNGLFHLRILTYRRLVSPSVPMYYVWQCVAVISMHTWFWSTIFHTRDTPVTEMMDYFSAFSLVLSNLFCLCCRVLGTDRPLRPAICGAVLLGMFLQHTYYLSMVKFDYGYNMIVNVTVGGVNMVGWLIWCCYHRHRYVWQCATVVLGLNVLLALELGEFPPLFWVFDAHSLWHASTFPLCYLWYSFIIDDGLYLMNLQKDKIF